MNKVQSIQQRLAVSRALLMEALRDPVWLILVQRWLQEKPISRSSVPTKRS